MRRRLLVSTFVLGGVGAFAAACSADEEAPGPVGAGPTEPQATAVLRPTEGNEAAGTVHFLEDDAGLRVIAEVRGLPPGPHGFHVHENGDCSSPDASSAGPHFAFASRDDPAERITGNLGELDAAEDGTARREARVASATLAGERSIVGRAVVVHAKGNDPSQPPDGAAGARIACGVIEETKPEEAR